MCEDVHVCVRVHMWVYICEGVTCVHGEGVYVMCEEYVWCFEEVHM